jgi:hypothetical protein
VRRASKREWKAPATAEKAIGYPDELLMSSLVPSVVSAEFVGKKLGDICPRTSKDAWATLQELFSAFLGQDTRRETA